MYRFAGKHTNLAPIVKQRFVTLNATSYSKMVHMKYFLLFLSAFVFAQPSHSVDFKSATAELQVFPENKTVSGKVTYVVDILHPIDSLKIDAQSMQFYDVTFNGKPITTYTNGKQLILIHPFLKGKNKIQFSYEARPKQALYFIGSEANDNLQIWTQGQGKYTSHWFPSFDDVNEKVIFNLKIQFKNGYDVISNGILKEKKRNNTFTTWKYAMTKPMSSYLLMLAIGKFEKQIDYSKSKIPLEFYLEPHETSKFEPTFRNSKRMFDFLEKEIGVKYPWHIYKQVPVRDFLYAGMENTTATTFSNRYVVDSIGFFDRNYINVNAHELAHQWFGNLITAENSKHHWLQEGFATYYALLAEKELYGADYFYSYLYDKAQELKFASRTDTIPLLHSKASSLTFYQKGAWALFVLHEKLGDAQFKKAVKKFLQNNAFQTVSTKDFLEEIEKVSDFETTAFTKVWLEDYRFNTLEANTLLNKNKNTAIQLQLDKMKLQPFIEKKDSILKLMQSNVYFKVKESLLKQIRNVAFEDCKDIINAAFSTSDTSIRQALAAWFTQIPPSFQYHYETLLQEPSYQTQEIALFKLWQNFPNDRYRYLDQTQHWKGFNDNNLRILWLALALKTPDYSNNPEALYQELIAYSSEKYEASTRQNALEYLVAFHIITPDVVKNLVNATTHHMWQFTKYGRDTIRKLLLNPTHSILFEELLPKLNEAEKQQLNRLLAEIKTK